MLGAIECGGRVYIVSYDRLVVGFNVGFILSFMVWYGVSVICVCVRMEGRDEVMDSQY